MKSPMQGYFFTWRSLRNECDETLEEDVHQVTMSQWAVALRRRHTLVIQIHPGEQSESEMSP